MVDPLGAKHDAVVVVYFRGVPRNKRRRAHTILPALCDDDVGVEFGIVASVILRQRVRVRAAVKGGGGGREERKAEKEGAAPFQGASPS